MKNKAKEITYFDFKTIKLQHPRQCGMARDRYINELKKIAQQ